MIIIMATIIITITIIIIIIIIIIIKRFICLIRLYNASSWYRKKTIK